MFRFYQYLIFSSEEDFNQNAKRQDTCYIIDHHTLEHKPNHFPAFLKKCSSDCHSMGWLITCDHKQIIDAIEKEIYNLNNVKAEIEQLAGD